MVDVSGHARGERKCVTVFADGWQMVELPTADANIESKVKS